jgi:2-haloacid dehalogenase
VLLDWDPRHLYRKLLAGPAAVERFLAEVCTDEWNREIDRGAPLSEAVDQLARRHPESAEAIRAYRDRWMEMVAGPLPGMADLVDELRLAGVPSYLLTNSSTETYPKMRERYPFLHRLAGELVSGEVGLLKPDPEIFQVLIERFQLRPGRTLFVDDRPENVRGAAAAGLRAIRFRGAAALRRVLRSAGVPLVSASR